MRGGIVGEKLGARVGGMCAVVSAAAWLLALPCYALGLLSNSPTIAFFLFLAPTALGLVWLGPVIAAIRERFPPQGQVSNSKRNTLFKSSAHFALGLRGRGFGEMADAEC